MAVGIGPRRQQRLKVGKGRGGGLAVLRQHGAQLIAHGRHGVAVQPDHRLRSHPAGLWRGTALSAGGLITTWLLLATLWMPALDYVRSYRDVSASLASALDRYRQPGECVRTQGLGSGQRASFLVFNNIALSFSGDCPLLLQQLDMHSIEATETSRPGYKILWEGRRGPDRHEMFRLVRVRPIP